LLVQLVESKTSSIPEIFENLWEKLENSNQYAYNKRCALIIELINRYQELYPEKIE